MVLIALAFTWPAAALAAPVLQVDEPVWNVGQVVSGVEQTRTLLVENAGDEPLVIEQVEQCCGFRGTVEKSRLMPGEKASLQLRLRPVQMVGDLRAEIFLVSNDPRQPRFAVLALGSVLPKRHALGELAAPEAFLDLGVALPGEAVPFTIRVKSVGNEPLQIVRIEKGKNVLEAASRLMIPPGEEGSLQFRFVGDRSGPIDESVMVVTNDALERTLLVRLKGYVARDWVPDRALVIYPVGMPAAYDPSLRGYRYAVVVDNRSTRPVELMSVESSLPATESRTPGVVEPMRKGEGVVVYPLSILHDGPVQGEVFLKISLPVEVR
jgi:hypothetical protein